MQGKDVSKYDAWKLILLSDLFPKVKIKTTHRIFTLQTVFSFVLYNVNGIFTEHLIRVQLPLKTSQTVTNPLRMTKKKRTMSTRLH